MKKQWSKASILVTLVILAAVAVFLFTGNIHTQFGEDTLKISCTYWKGAEIAYDSIDSVEYRENGVEGERFLGIGSPKLSVGRFTNDEWGRYERYTEEQCPSCVVIEAGGVVYVLNSSSIAETKAIYQQLLEKVQ